MSKNKNQLIINSFKNWQYGEHKITQYKRFLFVISRNDADVWNTRTLWGAVRFINKHKIK